jgi:hypothetical protein
VLLTIPILLSVAKSVEAREAASVLIAVSKEEIFCFKSLKSPTFTLLSTSDLSAFLDNSSFVANFSIPA